MYGTPQQSNNITIKGYINPSEVHSIFNGSITDKNDRIPGGSIEKCHRINYGEPVFCKKKDLELMKDYEDDKIFCTSYLNGMDISQYKNSEELNDDLIYIGTSNQKDPIYILKESMNDIPFAVSVSGTSATKFNSNKTIPPMTRLSLAVPKFKREDLNSYNSSTYLSTNADEDDKKIKPIFQESLPEDSKYALHSIMKKIVNEEYKILDDPNNFITQLGSFEDVRLNAGKKITASYIAYMVSFLYNLSIRDIIDINTPETISKDQIVRKINKTFENANNKSFVDQHKIFKDALLDIRKRIENLSDIKSKFEDDEKWKEYSIDKIFKNNERKLSDKKRSDFKWLMNRFGTLDFNISSSIILEPRKQTYNKNWLIDCLKIPYINSSLSEGLINEEERKEYDIVEKIIGDDNLGGSSKKNFRNIMNNGFESSIIGSTSIKAMIDSKVKFITLENSIPNETSLLLHVP